jgi:phosphoribosylanthranilate isomerase
MRIKICGIRSPQQGKAIAQFGATALGFICVPASPRFVSIEQIQEIIELIPAKTDRIGVFANTTISEITDTVSNAGLTGVQLHGDELPEFCQQLRQVLPNIEIIKALRIRGVDDITNVNIYADSINTFLLDAYHPQQLGGTGKTLDWDLLAQFKPIHPWFLAGGLTPDNITEALSQIQPNGIDLSSGVEHTPGDKDLDKVAKLFWKLGNGGVESRE